MLKKCELYLIEVIQGKKTGIGASLLKIFLKFLSLFYGVGLSIRSALYRYGLIKTYRPHAVVISVGNITAGGTGKTPAILMLAEEFKNIPTALLSRGYCSPAEKEKEPICLSKGNGPLYSAHQCGDEPYLIVDNFPQLLAYVGKNRSRGAELAVDAGAKLILVDDGMQHRKLERDFDIAIMDARDPFGQGHLLPRGLLRDRPEALSCVDLIIFNHVDTYEHYQSVKKGVEKYTNAPTVAVKPEVVAILGSDGSRIDSIAGKKIAIFCGIARPDYFEQTIKQLGGKIVHRKIIPDHEMFELSDIQLFAKECKEKGFDLLMCTEKDKVKLNESITSSFNYAWVQMRLKILYDQENWEIFIKKVHDSLR